MPILPRNGTFPQTAPNVQGWGRDFSNTEICTGFFYDLERENTYTFTPNEQFNVILNTPRSVAQQFAYTRQPDVDYLTLYNRNPVCLLTESCQPLVTEADEVLVI